MCKKYKKVMCFIDKIVPRFHCTCIGVEFCLIVGLQIVYTLDEVTFVQNLVFYIETAYRTPVSIYYIV